MASYVPNNSTACFDPNINGVKQSSVHKACQTM